ncbi:MAG: hypothetical protein U5L96_10185 [Owenweeksia sp.]|nr:hypothetical protein [Owenweeksia sp.]
MQKLKKWKSETATFLEETCGKLEGLSLENPEEEDTRLEQKLNSLRKGELWSKDLEKLRKNHEQENTLLKKNI